MPTNRLLVKEEIATYAGMLLDAAFSEGGQERVLDVRDQLETVLSLYRGNTDLREALTDPAYPEQRGRLAANVFEGIDPLVNSVITVMAERNNLGELSQVVSAFYETSEEKLGVCVVDVTTVVALDDELRSVITEKLSKDLGKKVVLRGAARAHRHVHPGRHYHEYPWKTHRREHCFSVGAYSQRAYGI